MDTIRILSIDGGGIRGIIPLTILEYIEDKTSRPIHELFDVVGGTSTGGIISLGLNSKSPTGQIYTARDLSNFYSLDASKIFEKDRNDKWEKIKNTVRDFVYTDHGSGITSPEYAAHGIETFLLEKFGADNRMSQLPTKCDVTVYSYDIENDCPYYFSKEKAQKFEDDYFVWEAARSTSAAPTFFPGVTLEGDPHKKRVLIDGGVFINNPSLELLVWAKKKYHQAEKFLLVSLGTGVFEKSRSRLKNAGAIGWLNNGELLNIMMSGASAAVELQLQQLIPELTDFQQYYRFQKHFTEDVGMDDIKPEKIARLQRLGEDMVAENREQLNKVCSHLTQSISPPEITKQACLEVKYTLKFQQYANDKGSLASQNLGAYSPLVEEGWYWLGQCVQNDHNKPYKRMLIVKPLNADAVKSPIHFEKVWTNQGSKMSSGYYSCWKPIPPDGYVALGYIMRLGVNNYDPPSSEEVKGFVCLHKSLVVSAEISESPVWKDSGSQARKDCSLWVIKPKIGAIDTGTFYGVDNYNRPNEQVWCLRADQVNFLWS